MPWIIHFVKPVQIVDRDEYINDCCIGGDIVLARLVPSLRQRYGEDIQANQEDWGWFAWFQESGVKLAVDVHTDDPGRGEFQLHLTSRRPRLLFGSKVEDTAQLEQLRDLVVSELQSWSVESLSVERVDDKYMPIQA